MPRIEWNDAMDDKIRSGRNQGKDWDSIADDVGVTRETLVRHATSELGLPSRRAISAERREALRAKRRLLRRV